MKRVCFFLLLFLIAVSAPGVAFAQESFEYGDNLDVPYVPTPNSVVMTMLKTAKVTKNDVVIDLGCGDGRVVVTAAKEFGARGIGYDLNPQRIAEANENAKQAGVESRVKFIEKNLFDADIQEATVVTLYLLPSVNAKLKPRLLQELKPGTRVVSHNFTMPDWPPKETVELEGRTVYLWVIPERASK